MTCLMPRKAQFGMTARRGVFWKCSATKEKETKTIKDDTNGARYAVWMAIVMSG